MSSILVKEFASNASTERCSERYKSLEGTVISLAQLQTKVNLVFTFKGIFL